MKFVVIGDFEKFELQLMNIFNNVSGDDDELEFCKEKSLACNKENTALVNLIFYCDRDSVTALLESAINGEESKLTESASIHGIRDEKEVNKVAKRVVSTVWLKFLENMTGTKHGWGILTGVRPVKLYYQLLKKFKSHNLVKKELMEKYLIKPEKVDLLKNIAIKQFEIIPDFDDISNEVSIYIGIPYCPTKCAYCTFPAYAIRRDNDSIDDFLQTLYQEIDAIGAWLQESKKKVTTIYMGGGTPTSLEAVELDEVFSRISKWIELDSVREITVEAGRPDTITSEKLDILKKWKIDRICINPQTFSNETLKTIGRKHTAEDIIEKYYLAREKEFDNINMDLIIGLPGETLSDVKDSLYQIEKLRPDSITIHSMAFKKHSELTRNRTDYSIAKHEEIIKMMDYVYRWTEEHNYNPYYLYRQKNILGNLENVGFCLDGKENIYNILIIAESQTIIALGCGAVSKLVKPDTLEVFRVPNPKDPKTYIDTQGQLSRKKIEQLDEIFNL